MRRKLNSVYTPQITKIPTFSLKSRVDLYTGKYGTDSLDSIMIHLVAKEKFLILNANCRYLLQAIPVSREKSIVMYNNISLPGPTAAYKMLLLEGIPDQLADLLPKRDEDIIIKH